MSDQQIKTAAFKMFAEMQRVNIAIKRHKLQKIIPPMDEAMIEFVKATNKKPAETCK